MCIDDEEHNDMTSAIIPWIESNKDEGGGIRIAIRLYFTQCDEIGCVVFLVYHLYIFRYTLRAHVNERKEEDEDDFISVINTK